MGYLTKLALSAAVTVAAGSAQAATVTFDFDAANRGAAYSLAYASGDLSLNVTATRGSAAAKVQTWSGHGMGVPGPNPDPHLVDSSGTGEDETVWFRFSELVNLVKVTFSYVDEKDDFKLWQGATSLGVFDVKQTVFTAAAGWADSFGVGAVDWRSRHGSGYSAFKITSVTVETQDAPAPVPLPAAGLMLAASLAGLGLAKRRKA
ncbi:VPLPA-CTERM sorting domain-containing protein [Rhodobacter sp. Har01]|uniref:VPLPA-CTERM sorting domain-containing protein n=1 Tax=Rhodobacter sp. Har01 TaxID=2883999 RepID=UPI001D060538|nr:VPLPA-CTERM sorting domain-containing protein [Rhodobacter sp. Har01]MCB6177224.1 VPLPA-CTERM sorting domain-containing protein [Rhodobacter sp. Har01]